MKRLYRNTPGVNIEHVSASLGRISETCPCCGRVAVIPDRMDRVGPDTTVCVYVCPACGCGWETSFWAVGGGL